VNLDEKEEFVNAVVETAQAGGPVRDVAQGGPGGRRSLLQDEEERGLRRLGRSMLREALRDSTATRGKGNICSGWYGVLLWRVC